MATMNAFDLLCDDDNEDPAQLIVAVQLKTEKLKKPLALAQPQAHVQLPKAAFLPSHLLWPRMKQGMKVDVEGAQVVDRALVVGVEVAVDLIMIQITVKLPLVATMDFLVHIDRLKRVT